jgi:hypothetical protein
VIVRSTAWLAMACFVAGEIGRRSSRTSDGRTRWPWAVFTAGALISVAHVLAAYHWQHGWNQASVVAETARQTAAVFGWHWAGGVYVNYVFVGVWLADAVWWRFDPALERRPVWACRSLRAFYFLVIVNAAVVFPQGTGRLGGVLLVAGLAWAWTRRAKSVPLENG